MSDLKMKLQTNTHLVLLWRNSKFTLSIQVENRSILIGQKRNMQMNLYENDFSCTILVFTGMKNHSFIIKITIANVFRSQ